MFYYNHVSPSGSDSCVAADFTVIPVETTQCEEKHKAESGTAFPNVLCWVFGAMHDAADFGAMLLYLFDALLTLKCRTSAVFQPKINCFIALNYRKV